MSKQNSSVSRQDCMRNHAKIDLALFGTDGRGGIVKDISEIKTFLRDQQQVNFDTKAEQTQCREDARTKRLAWTNEKVTVLSVAVAIIAVVLAHLLDKLW
jgi:hypothetical protein